jgi:hypothetical protein
VGGCRLAPAAGMNGGRDRILFVDDRAEIVHLLERQNGAT